MNLPSHWRTLLVGMAGALTLAACSTGSSGTAPATSAASSAAPTTSSTTSAPVESAASGDVAGVSHPLSGCRAKDDMTANARIYNEVALLTIEDFKTVGSEEAKSVWLKQTGRKEWGEGAEGEYECASPPMAVKNDTRQTYYFWDGVVWGDHPGWWGAQESVDWEADPRGLVEWTCSGANPNKAGWQACPDSALDGAKITAPWSLAESSYEQLKDSPECSVSGGSLIGCYTLSRKNGSMDFAFDTYAWTAPMRVSIITRWAPVETAWYPATSKAGDTTAVQQQVFAAWRVAEAYLVDAQWAQLKSPQGVVIKPGSSNTISVGAYAVPSSGRHSIQLKLVPAYLTNAQGEALNCTKGPTKTTCSYVKADEAEPAGDFLKSDVSVPVTASLTLDRVSRNGGPPVVTATPISCTPSAATVAGRNLSAECKSEGGEAGSAYKYGASWSVLLKV